MSEAVNVSTVYLVPVALHEGANHTIPAYILDAVKDCRVFFVENERTARRFLKALWKEMVIDDYTWVVIDKAGDDELKKLREFIKKGVNIGIMSEAGCPGIADPGQKLVATAHAAGATVKPLVGPSSLLLALMASGLNGQRFQFNGYLPIDSQERGKAIRQLESESVKKDCTQLFIETPYRNNQLMEMLVKTLQPSTKICVAADLTSEKEWIKTMKVSEWKNQKPDLHKRPAIFCIYAGT